VSALRRFRRCVELCDAARTASPRRRQSGDGRFLPLLRAGVRRSFADLEAARALAVKLGNRFAEMFTLEGQGSLLSFRDRYAEARPFVERGLALASAISAKRYEATLLTELAEVDFATGRDAEARGHVDHAIALFREIGMAFWGPTALGFARGCRTTRTRRERDRAEAEAISPQGA
jgi:hypothetical protein